MEIPDFVVAATVGYLARRFTQISFSIPHAFDSEPTDEPDNHPAVTSSEDSTDSASQAFLFAEDFVVGCLIRLRASALHRDPSMNLHLVRHRARAYFSGHTICLSRTSSLAAVSSLWLRVTTTELVGRWCLRTHYLEQVSRANRLPYKILRRTEDEYFARFTGRVRRSIQWGQAVSPTQTL